MRIGFIWINMGKMSQDSAVVTATCYGLDGRRDGVRLSEAARFFSSPCYPDGWWGPSSLPFNGYWRLFHLGKAGEA